jgi:ATP-dependent RNA helicase RhlE
MYLISSSYMKYSDLNLDARLNAAIDKLQYAEATAIQEQTIPHILEGKDVAGLAQTGTGKTAAFLIPLIERILRAQSDKESSRAFKDWNARSYILILVPTRELADQINDNVIKLSDGCGIKTYPLYGGTGYEKQKAALNEGLQFVVSTPGRLIDLFKENCIDLKQVKAIVFDEADRMFDMGFKDDMKYILQRIPKERQFLVFSATLNFDVLNTAYQFGAEPVEINISRDQAKAENVKDWILHIGDNEKPMHLLSILKKENAKQVMIFTNFKHNVDRLSSFLIQNKIPAMGISSLMSQSQRNSVIEKFKAENDQNILVATDVAARGLDINGVDLVINFEMPQDPESYVHRIGRTGRAGREGKAFSFISDKDIDSLARVEEYTKKKIEASFLEDSELIKDFKTFTEDSGGYKKKFDKPFNKRRDEHDKKDNSRRFDKNKKPFVKNADRSDTQSSKRGGYVKPNQAAANTAPAAKPAPFDKNRKPHNQNNNQQPKHQNVTTKVVNKSFRKGSSGSSSKTKAVSSNQQGLVGAVKSFFQKIFG